MSDNKLPPNIIVIEENEVVNSNICNYIERSGFDTTRVFSYQNMNQFAELNNPHVAVISCNLVKDDPIDVANKLRKQCSPYLLPVIFLLNNSEDSEKYKLSNSELVQYITRPFTPDILMTLIKDMLRIANPVFMDKVIMYKDLGIDLRTSRVIKGGKEYSFGPIELKILKLLIQKPKQVFSRREIIDYVWDKDKTISDRTIDVHINRIRRILEVKNDDNPLIKTMRASGYRLD